MAESICTFQTDKYRISPLSQIIKHPSS